jgi:hypothetical protein
MAVSTLLSVLRAMAGRARRVVSKRLISSEARCWASPEEPPLPQLSTCPLACKVAIKRWLACAKGAASAAADFSLQRMLARKAASIQSLVVMGWVL